MSRPWEERRNREARDKEEEGEGGGRSRRGRSGRRKKQEGEGAKGFSTSSKLKRSQVSIHVALSHKGSQHQTLIS